MANVANTPVVIGHTTNTRKVSELFARLGLPEFAVKRHQQKKFLMFVNSELVRAGNMERPTDFLRYMAHMACLIEKKLRAGRNFKVAYSSAANLTPTFAKVAYVMVDDQRQIHNALYSFWVQGPKLRLVGKQDLKTVDTSEPLITM